MGDVVNPDTGKKVKFGRNDEDAAAQYAAELSKMGQGKFEPYFETKGLNHYAIRKVGESITGAGGTTTGGATGGELNNAGAEFVGTGGNGAGSNVSIMNEGAKVNTVSANQTHMSEDTGTSDKKVQDNLYD